MLNFSPYAYVLILRIWYEPDSAATPAAALPEAANASGGSPQAWRCMIEDVESREKYYFTTTEKLFSFLSEKIGREDTP